MPHFSESGHDVVLCQKCGRDIDTEEEKVEWRPDITKNTSAGLVCAPCIEKHGNPSMSLYEYCHIESDGLTGAALTRYVNRYYGHG